MMGVPPKRSVRQRTSPNFQTEVARRGSCGETTVVPHHATSSTDVNGVSSDAAFRELGSADRVAAEGTGKRHTAAGLALVIPNGRPQAIVAFEVEVVSFFVDAADLLGVPKSLAAIYGICFASPEPLGFAEIETRLDISTGSISQGLRILREVGALKVVTGTSAPDSQLSALSSQLSTGNSQLSTRSRQRERYEPDLGLRKVVTHFIESRLDPQLDSGRVRLQALARQVSAGNSSSKVLKARLKALHAWHDRARAVLPVVKTFLKL